MTDTLAVNIPEAARRLGVSPRTVATLVARKELLSRKIGRRRVIPVAALEAFLRRDHPIQAEGHVRKLMTEEDQILLDAALKGNPMAQGEVLTRRNNEEDK